MRERGQERPEQRERGREGDGGVTLYQQRAAESSGPHLKLLNKSRVPLGFGRKW